MLFFLDYLSGAVSIGQKQRVAITTVMVTAPGLLVLDEATSELDALMVQKIFSICAQFNRELGTTILLVSHEVYRDHPSLP
jgi:ABC-type methionine transport system ATPase subunit